MPALWWGDRHFPEVAAIFFDKDGTLADSRRFWAAVGQRRARAIAGEDRTLVTDLLKLYGIGEGGLDPRGLMAVGTRQENAIASAVLLVQRGSPWLRARERVEMAFAAVDGDPQTPPPPLPGVRVLVEQLHRLGLPLAILSADTEANIYAFLEDQGWGDRFALCLGADSGYPPKPDPAMYRAACDRLGVAPGKTIMVGDAPGDIVMAQHAQALATIGVGDLDLPATLTYPSLTLISVRPG